MAGKITKKGKNPGAVDSWLDTLGFYRKNVAYDETCLFRAVSEQLFDCQVFHERIRKECIEYARKNYDEFTFLESNENKWQEHLNLLEKHMVVCGNIEIHIISSKYKRDVMLFEAARQELFNVTRKSLPNPLLLCLMDEDHYDVVYKRDHINTAGYCQSIIYKILYEEVFHIANVDDIVNSMLYGKTNLPAPTDCEDKKECGASDSKSMDENEDLAGSQNVNEAVNIAPFPFKVAKALDPAIYRNIEYDSWGEVRRELRLGDWYYGDDKLILGTRCVLSDPYSCQTHDCYIQEIIKDENKCIVYLTKLAEKRTVNYADLSPENNAKPWPLPYRFSKNLVISPTLPPTPDKSQKNVKKRNKDKRRTKSCSDSNMIPSANNLESAENINPYVGIPLQMHNTNDSSIRQVDESTTEADCTNVQECPEVPSTPNRYSWDGQPWSYLPPTPDPFVWPQTPTTPQAVFNFSMKPMVASAPVTPDVISYHDPNYLYYYNYVDPYNTYNQWGNSSNEYNLSIAQETPEKQVEISKSPKAEANSFDQTENINEQQERTTTVCTTYSNPPVEVFSPMMIPPGTPVIYTPGHPEMTEIVLPTPPIAIYTPPVDMQYVSPGPYVYPPTPPTSWYPAGINSQGFIFPPPLNAQTPSKGV